MATPETERAVRPATQLACTPQSIYGDVGDPTPSDGDETSAASDVLNIQSHHMASLEQDGLNDVSPPVVPSNEYTIYSTRIIGLMYSIGSIAIH